MRKATLLFLSVFLTHLINAQETWKKEQLMDTKDLAEKINSSQKDKPVIFNMGPMSQIKGAVKIGAGSTEEGIKKLNTEAATLKVTTPIVLYCGCCSSANCPNIKPAHKHLVAKGFTNVKILDIPEGLAQDWTSKGYPVE